MCWITLPSAGISSGMHLSYNIDKNLQLKSMSLTGIGSYIMKGFQSGILFTACIIDSALEGEQMKCRWCGYARLVPSRSFGVKRIRSVRYSKLPLPPMSNQDKRDIADVTLGGFHDTYCVRVLFPWCYDLENSKCHFHTK